MLPLHLFPLLSVRLTGKWNLDAKMLTFGTSQCDRMIDIYRILNVRSVWLPYLQGKVFGKGTSFVDLFKLLPTIPQAPPIICKMRTINPTW